MVTNHVDGGAQPLLALSFQLSILPGLGSRGETEHLVTALWAGGSLGAGTSHKK